MKAELLFFCMLCVLTVQVQKEINQLAGKLDRVFTMTDELVYKDAKKDEARRQAYKMLASLRDVSWGSAPSFIKSILLTLLINSVPIIVLLRTVVRWWRQ